MNRQTKARKRNKWEREGGEKEAKDKLTKWVFKNGEFIHTRADMCLKLSDCGTEMELQRDEGGKHEKRFRVIHSIKAFSQIKWEKKEEEGESLTERLAESNRNDYRLKQISAWTAESTPRSTYSLLQTEDKKHQ